MPPVFCKLQTIRFLFNYIPSLKIDIFTQVSQSGPLCSPANFVTVLISTINRGNIVKRVIVGEALPLHKHEDDISSFAGGFVHRLDDFKII